MQRSRIDRLLNCGFITITIQNFVIDKWTEWILRTLVRLGQRFKYLRYTDSEEFIDLFLTHLYDLLRSNASLFAHVLM